MQAVQTEERKTEKDRRITQRLINTEYIIMSYLKAAAAATLKKKHNTMLRCIDSLAWLLFVSTDNTTAVVAV